MNRKLLLAFMLLWSGHGHAQDNAPAAGSNMVAHGRASIAPEPFLRTGDAVALCLRADQQWVDFCNGLVQGYVEYAILHDKVCIPAGTTRRQLVEVFTGPDVVVSTGYIDDLPAFETALEMFIKHFPCD